MLQSEPRYISVARVEKHSRAESADLALDLRDLIRALLRQKLFVAAAIVICLTLGVGFWLISPASYTSSAKVLLNKRSVNFLQQGGASAMPSMDASDIQDQMELIGSDSVANATILQLNLEQNPLFLRKHGYFNEILQLLSFGEFSADKKAVASIHRVFKERLSVVRIDKSHVVEIAFTSPDPVLSAMVANGIVDAFIKNQLASMQEVASRAQTVLKDNVVLSAAIPPTERDGPRMSLILATALLIGIVLGGIVAFLREYWDDTIRVPEELEKATGAICLGVLPVLAPQHTSGSHGDVDVSPGQCSGGRQPVLLRSGSLLACDDRLGSTLFTDTLNYIKAILDAEYGGRGACVIAVTSALPGEGKTSAALNLARILARSGKSTLLIDCDLRNPGLTPSLAPKATMGVPELVQHEASWPDAIWEDCTTAMHFLPASTRKRVEHHSDIIASQEMMALIQRGREMYNYIVLDMPPLVQAADARIAARLADTLLLIVEWGKTSHAIVRKSLNLIEPVGDKLLGSVLNKVEMGKFSRWDADAGALYGQGRRATRDQHECANTDSNNPSAHSEE